LEKFLKMKSLRLKKSVAFISYPKSWIKNKLTGEVKWFEANSRNAEDAAAMHWAFFDSKGKMENLGSSFFDTKTNNSLDNSQIQKQQKAYLLAVSLKINKSTGVKEDPFNNITFEYLSSIFLGTPFGSKSNNSSDLPGVIWDYGGGNFVESKLPNTKIVRLGFKSLDIYLSSENVGMGSDMVSNVRANAVNYFMTRTKNYIDSEVLFRIKQHKF
jgi:hypothetical protein